MSSNETLFASSSKCMTFKSSGMIKDNKADPTRYDSTKNSDWIWNANLHQHQQTGMLPYLSNRYSNTSINVAVQKKKMGWISHHPLPSTDKQLKQTIIQDVFSAYSKFLGKPSLTLGLCRSMPSVVEEDCNRLQTSLLHLNVFRFDKPRIVKPSKHLGLLIINTPYIYLLWRRMYAVSKYQLYAAC